MILALKQEKITGNLLNQCPLWFTISLCGIAGIFKVFESKLKKPESIIGIRLFSDEKL
jgi:hypothetical protein